MDNIKTIDLHTHSVLSRHAFSSITENIEYASSIGLKILGCLEHQYDNYGVGSSEHIIGGLINLVPSNYNGMRILKGIELNILDGHFDVDKYHNRINELDYTIASIHPYAYSKEHTYKQNTDNYIMACNTSYVKILGHMDHINYDCDFEAVIKEAIKNKVLIELNNSSLAPTSVRKNAKEIDTKILKLCEKHNCPIIVNSDAHIKYNICKLDSAYALLNELNFPSELVINNNEELIKEYFNI